MQLTLWTYEGPTHVGAMRVATAMRDVHYVLHAPQGDTYADLLFTMIERLPRRPPVTYTTFQARDLGGDTAELFKTAAAEAVRTLPAEGDAGRRLVHRRADPGRSGRPRARARPADPGGAARAARLPAQGELGRGGDLLPAGAHPRRPVRAAARHSPPRTRRRPARALQPARPDGARLPSPRRRPRNPWPAGTPGRRGVGGRSARRDGGRSGPPRRRRLQRGAVPRDRLGRRRSGCSAASASRPPRPSRSAPVPPASSSARWPSSPASTPRPRWPTPPRARPGTPARSTPPT